MMLTPMNDDLDAARGIINGVLLSLPFWVTVLVLFLLFGPLG